MGARWEKYRKLTREASFSRDCRYEMCAWSWLNKVRDVAGKVWSKGIRPALKALAPTIDKYMPMVANAANSFAPGLGSAVNSGWSSIKGKVGGPKFGSVRLKPDIDPDKRPNFG
jgi:hypothetical protein